MTVVLIVLGVVLGALLLDGGGGFVFGGLTGYLLGQVVKLRREIRNAEANQEASTDDTSKLWERIRKLEAGQVASTGDISTLRDRVRRLEVPEGTPEVVVGSAEEIAVTGTEEDLEPVPTPPDPADDTSVPLAPEALPAADSSAVESPAPSDEEAPAGGAPLAHQGPSFEVFGRLFDLIKTWATTGNVPVKVGVLLSLIGLAFLLGVALEQGWITLSIEVRHVLVALFGVLLLVVGRRVRVRNPIYGLSLQGGGIAVLYLTTYVAHAINDLLPAPAAAAAVVVITVGAGVLAVLEDARSLAVLGIIGGFLAPVLAYSDAEDHVIVFGFYVILSAAIVAVAWFKMWPELNLLGLGFTLGVSVFWLFQRYVEADWSTTQPLIALLIFMYLTIPLVFAVRRPSDLKDWTTGPFVFGLPFAGLGFQALLTGHFEYGPAISSLALAVIHGLFAVTAYRFGRQASPLRDAYSALAMTFLAIAAPLAFGAQYISIVWVLQGTFLVWIGASQRRTLATWGGLLLQALGGIAFVVHIADDLPYPDGATPLINGFFLGAALLAAAGMFTARTLESKEDHLGLDRNVPWYLLFWGIAWWLCAGLLETIGQVSPHNRLSVSIVFVTISLGVMALVGPVLNWRRMATSGVLLLPALVVALVITLRLQDHPFESNGWAAWIVALGIHYAVLRLRESAFPLFMEAMHVGAYWLLAILIGMEVHWQVGEIATGVWPMITALATVLAVVGGTLVARRAVTWPLGDHWPTYLTSCAGPALLVVAVMVITTNLTSDGASPPLTYLPLLNPLEVVTVAVVVAVLAWKRLAELQEDHPLEDLLARSWAPGLTVVGVVLLTMAVTRTVHHWLGVPFDFDEMIESTMLQASLSIVWGIAGLSGMVAGMRLVRRTVWVGGASLMGVVVVKLFLFDLSNTGTVARVVSFLGVGLLLLVVGYFAPVPPAASSQDAASSAEVESKDSG